jgi:hypothetical protein
VVLNAASALQPLLQSPSREVCPQRSPRITGAMRFLVLWQKNRLVRGQGWDRIQNLCVTKSPWREGSECVDSPIRIVSCSRAPHGVASVVNRGAHGVDSLHCCNSLLIESVSHTCERSGPRGDRVDCRARTRTISPGKKHGLTLRSRLHFSSYTTLQKGNSIYVHSEALPQGEDAKRS